MTAIIRITGAEFGPLFVRWPEGSISFCLATNRNEAQRFPDIEAEAIAHVVANYYARISRHTEITVVPVQLDAREYLSSYFAAGLT